MRVLQKLDVAKVATTRMSDDGRVLVVDRFDVDENAEPACATQIATPKISRCIIAAGTSLPDTCCTPGTTASKACGEATARRPGWTSGRPTRGEARIICIMPSQL